MLDEEQKKAIISNLEEALNHDHVVDVEFWCHLSAGAAPEMKCNIILGKE